MTFFISDEYTYLADRRCTGDDITSYTMRTPSYATLEDAKAACENNIECGCIDDYVTSFLKRWYLHKGKRNADNPNYCAWIKGKSKLTFPFYSSKFIYFIMCHKCMLDVHIMQLMIHYKGS